MFFICFFNDTAPTDIYTLSLHDALPILASTCSAISSAIASACAHSRTRCAMVRGRARRDALSRSEEHTSELQSLTNLVCRLLLEKKKAKPLSRRHGQQVDGGRCRLHFGH